MAIAASIIDTTLPQKVHAWSQRFSTKNLWFYEQLLNCRLHVNGLSTNNRSLYWKTQIQAWSNDEYRSVEHKVVANDKMERYSVAYFLCPFNNTVINGCKGPSVYRKFTFGEYRHQIQEDVKKIGHKIGLSRFKL